MMHNKYLPVLFWLISLTLTAQEWKDKGPDELFELARQEAFDGNYELARQMLGHILVQAPDYADVRILLGRTYAWVGEREKAEEAFDTVLKNDPQHQDALNALIDVRIWAEAYDQALATASTALKYHPNFEDFIYKKASILHQLKRSEDAMATLTQLLELNPAHEKGLALREDIKSTQQRHSLNVRTGVDFFSRNYDPALYASASLSRLSGWGSSIARVNFARRFQISGVQGEIDLYPKITNGLYGYLNYGYSQSALFPEHRFGAELFSKLPVGFEGSLGARQLIFSKNSSITMYTASLGWYHKSMWLSVRPFVTPGTSSTMTFTARRYFGSRDTYIGLSGGFGYSPDIRTIQSGQGFATEEIFSLEAQRLGLMVQKLLRYDLIASLNADAVRQELSFSQDDYVWITSIQANLTYRF